MSRSIINEEIKIILKKREFIALLRTVKKKKMHVNSMKFSLTKSMHLEEIIVRVIFLCFMYIIAYLIISVIIKDVKIKTIFNNKIKVNCILELLIDVV